LRFSSKSMCARKAVFVKKIANIFTIFCENIFLMITLTPGRIYLRTFLTEKKILGWIEGLVANLNSKLCSRTRKGSHVHSLAHYHLNQYRPTYVRSLHSLQGDQIGLIFTYTFGYFYAGQLFSITEADLILCHFFLLKMVYMYITVVWGENGSGNSLGDFFHELI
jgi:hypothetical protein